MRFDVERHRREASVPRLWPELRGQLDEPPEHVSSTDSHSSGEDEGAVTAHLRQCWRTFGELLHRMRRGLNPPARLWGDS